VDTYQVAYTELNQVKEVLAKLDEVQKNKTTYDYDPNGAMLSYIHDKQRGAFEYDPRNMVSKVTNTTAENDPDPKVTTYTYTDRGERLHEVKPNNNTIDHTYYLDGLLRTQVERRAETTVVSEHTIEYDLNGNRVRDVTRNQNADNHSAYVSTTTVNTFDPRDRIAAVTKTGDGAGTETYVHDANNNVVSSTFNNVTSNNTYDRNRLRSATASGVTFTYNYDPFGRLDTVTAGSVVKERNIYDGFDHIVENRKTGAGATKYTYDPMDRTTTRTTDAGTPREKTTTFNYLGLSNEVLDEAGSGRVDGPTARPAVLVTPQRQRRVADEDVLRPAIQPRADNRGDAVGAGHAVVVFVTGAVLGDHEVGEDGFGHCATPFLPLWTDIGVRGRAAVPWRWWLRAARDGADPPRPVEDHRVDRAADVGHEQGQVALRGDGGFGAPAEGEQAGQVPPPTAGRSVVEVGVEAEVFAERGEVVAERGDVLGAGGDDVGGARWSSSTPRSTRSRSRSTRRP